MGEVRGGGRERGRERVGENGREGGREGGREWMDKNVCNILQSTINNEI